MIRYSCERCSKSFRQTYLEYYNGGIFCFDCVDEIKEEAGNPHD